MILRAWSVACFSSFEFFRRMICALFPELYEAANQLLILDFFLDLVQ